ncbi:hypothetical protein ACFX2J_022474 [Malus domestica]
MAAQKQSEEAITFNQTVDMKEEKEHAADDNSGFNLKSFLWHGGSISDAWFSCASNQFAQNHGELDCLSDQHSLRRILKMNKAKKNVSFDHWKIDNSTHVFLSSDVNSKNKNFNSAMPFDSVQFHGSSLPFLEAVAARIELSSTVPHHCVRLPYLQAPRPSHLI